MKVKDLTGKLHHLDIRQSAHPMKGPGACKSKFQYECGQLIKQKFPTEIILEELPIPGHNLTLDFFIPTRKIAFEAQGGQHHKYNAHFHKNEKGFDLSKNRDLNKKLWCEANDVSLYTVDSVEELKELFGL